LLEVDVQHDVITALVQFYDPYLRCFIFKDFQLATTTEELTGFLGFYWRMGNSIFILVNSLNYQRLLKFWK
jgi:uncharacterized protein Usg